MNFPYHHGPYNVFPLQKDLRAKSKISGVQRKAANERERKRMNSINKGFDVLRGRLPVDIKDRKLSKVDTLKFATKYIEQLLRLLEEPSQTKRPSTIVVHEGPDPSIFVVSWKKSTEKYGEVHQTIQGPQVCTTNVWYPGK